jgi:hypothetical protein
MLIPYLGHGSRMRRPQAMGEGLSCISHFASYQFRPTLTLTPLTLHRNSPTNPPLAPKSRTSSPSSKTSGCQAGCRSRKPGRSARSGSSRRSWRTWWSTKINRNLKRKQEEAEKEAKGKARRSVSTTDDKKVLGQAAVAKKGAELDTDPESGSESSSEAEPGRKKRPKVSNIWLRSSIGRRLG